MAVTWPMIIRARRPDSAGCISIQSSTAGTECRRFVTTLSSFSWNRPSRGGRSAARTRSLAVACLDALPSRRSTMVRCCSPGGPTGMTRRPPSASWDGSVSGTAGAPAVTRMRSNGRGFRPALGAVPDDDAGRWSHPSSCSRSAACRARLRWRSIEITGRGQPRQNRRLIARSGADLRGRDRCASGAKCIRHQGDHVGLRNRLLLADRERPVVIGLARCAAGTN